MGNFANPPELALIYTLAQDAEPGAVAVEFWPPSEGGGRIGTAYLANDLAGTWSVSFLVLAWRRIVLGSLLLLRL